jgi:asparagine synthase (glutamine-hydrolysing)
MSGIVGSDTEADTTVVEEALATIGHRGPSGSRILEASNATLGQVWTEARERYMEGEDEANVVLDGDIHNWTELSPGATSPLEAIEGAYEERGPDFVSDLDGHFALAVADKDGVFLARDPLGVVPLYYSVNGATYFASEAKALADLDVAPEELPPGHYYDPKEGLVEYYRLEEHEPFDTPAEELATGLRDVLVAAIAKVATNAEVGAWLSGGLDSSAIAALLRRQTADLHTFAVGFEGAPDLRYARMVAEDIGATHHEWICTREELLEALPQVVYHLESFDALLVRSSMTNYLVGKLASEHVPIVLSGEGGDELFAGYEYLKGLRPCKLQDELLDITGRLHNTALQRVDRCSMAHGLIAHVPFLDQDVVAYALRIPPRYKLNREAGMVEKWILRRALDGLLPVEVLERKKAKFWEGAGVEDVISRYAEQRILDAEFSAERQLPDGSVLNTKEELMYYRIFCDHFGEDADSSLVGRTKGAPVEP